VEEKAAREKAEAAEKEARKKVVAASSGKVVVANCINEGFFSFFLNWVQHYRRAELRYPVHSFPEDQTAEKLLLAYKRGMGSSRDGFDLTVEKYVPVPAGAAGPETRLPQNPRELMKLQRAAAREGPKNGFVFGTESWRKLVGQRSTRLLRLLNQGFTVIYSDIDSVLLRDPMTYAVGDYDVWWSVDRASKVPNYCTGFSIMKPVDSVSKLLTEHVKRIYSAGLGHNQHDQSVMNNLVNGDFAKEVGLRSTGLPRNVFPNGVNYWKGIDEMTKQPLAGLNKTECVWVHANYVQGKALKIKRLREAGLWDPELDR